MLSFDKTDRWPIGHRYRQPPRRLSLSGHSREPSNSTKIHSGGWHSYHRILCYPHAFLCHSDNADCLAVLRRHAGAGELSHLRFRNGDAGCGCRSEHAGCNGWHGSWRDGDACRHSNPRQEARQSLCRRHGACALLRGLSRGRPVACCGYRCCTGLCLSGAGARTAAGRFPSRADGTPSPFRLTRI